MKRILDLFLLLVFALPALTACDNSEDTDAQWTGWKERNEAYFDEKMRTARAAIADARAAYGDDWETHCAWRVYKDYSLAADQPGTATDSVCVEIVRNGTGSGCPIFTDSVRVNYRGMLIPNELAETQVYRDGYVFSYTGISKDFDDVFNPETAMPAMMYVGSLTTGLCTAVQYMHIGDLWRVYAPASLGYGSTEHNVIPAWSTLVFEIELKAYYHAGVVPPVWRMGMMQE